MHEKRALEQENTRLNGQSQSKSWLNNIALCVILITWQSFEAVHNFKKIEVYSNSFLRGLYDKQ